MGRLYLAIAVIGFMVVIIWYVTSGPAGEPIGAACQSNQACQSEVCLPDADPKEVARFAEITKAFEQGQGASPMLGGEVAEMIDKLPRSSLTLRPIYPGVCTQPCNDDTDCPQEMFCADAVWVRAIKKIGKDRIQVCMPDDHPAARLQRQPQNGVRP